nr:hypothetical protein Iba_chr12cCG12880 [Ipomoea batatas]
MERERAAERGGPKNRRRCHYSDCGNDRREGRTPPLRLLGSLGVVKRGIGTRLHSTELPLPPQSSATAATRVRRRRDLRCRAPPPSTAAPTRRRKSRRFYPPPCTAKKQGRRQLPLKCDVRDFPSPSPTATAENRERPPPPAMPAATEERPPRSSSAAAIHDPSSLLRLIPHLSTLSSPSPLVSLSASLCFPAVQAGGGSGEGTSTCVADPKDGRLIPPLLLFDGASEQNSDGGSGGPSPADGGRRVGEADQ